MQRHTTTGVTAAGILTSSIAGGGGGAGSGINSGGGGGAVTSRSNADSTSAGGLSTPSFKRRSGSTGRFVAPLGLFGVTTGGAAATVATSAGGGSSASAPAADSAHPTSTLGRMIGAPNTSLATGPPHSPRSLGPPGVQRSSPSGTALSGAPAGGAGGGMMATTALLRPGVRATPKGDVGSGSVGRKVAAVDNIGDALGRFFQESMDLAPRPPPRPPSSSSSSDGDPGPFSSDDEAVTQEELDVLEKIYLWPPGSGVTSSYNLLLETRHAVAAALAGAEDEEAQHSGPCDRVGEVGRLTRRYRKQGAGSMFNLSHAVNGVDQVVALVDVLGHPDLAGVSELLLAGNALGDAAFRPLGARLASPACASLRQLDLGSNGLTAASVELLLPLMKDEMAGMSKAQRLRRGLLDGRPPHGVLTRLVLDANPIGDAGAELLCEAAASDYTQLAELRLSRCGLGERGGAAAGRLLENSSAIRILDLSWNTLGRRGGQALGEGLKSASSIQQLLLGWTGITDTGASYIAKAIKSNATLQLLDMSGDSVSGDTSLVLLDSVQDNGALRVIILRDNPVGVLAARRLLKAANQGVIESVDLLGCSFGGMGSSTVVWDPHDPDGVYDLDLEVPAHYQVGVRGERG
ncbi:hypothetical protein GPECTOR_44g68 [Gonium pectorale]|uniref:Uncharacterized protein n=1 Tax=Gonium pectorale TaxID=33097 RepID=A0A150G967_GONPE|nr:hypothetical protein GPECTOR_44g68 [Gonium pectorale]|eukprot:KXZ46392.1 hypothetical protein GPECTOR_44g68 [Gonium pectorale]